MADYYLKVFTTKSEIVHSDGKTEVFSEGSPSEAAKIRYHQIEEALKSGFLEKQIILCRDHPSGIDYSGLINQHRSLIDKLLNSVTSEVGRALIGLTTLQLSVKAIVPKQSIRLHKGGPAANNFSWEEGISMRSLDKKYITPLLRRYDLLKLNADGFMMTRSLAENYPYSKVYKANLRGARNEWIEIVEEVELGRMNAPLALQYMFSKLINNAQAFKTLASDTLVSFENFITVVRPLSKEKSTKIILDHVNQSDYSARLMEISMHSLMQALQKFGVLGSMELQPLSQMRSANKKHGNIADIELEDNGEIVEAWDAKYEKPYLRDELEELAEKLNKHSELELAGFVTSIAPTRLDELKTRISEVEDLNGVKIKICKYEDWVKLQFSKIGNGKLVTEEILAEEWIRAYTESLAQMRRDLAPIDEPCQQWLSTLKNVFDGTY